MATKKGLLRFGPDGIERFSAENGLGGDETTSLSLAGDGSVWIGTEGGLTAWQHGRLRHFPAKEHLRPFAYSALCDAEGQIWAGTSTGLSMLDPATDSYTQVWGEHDPSTDNAADTVRCLLKARSGGFWFGTDRSLGVYRGGTIELDSLGEAGSASRVKGVLEDRRGALWAIIGYVLHRKAGERFVAMDEELGLTDAIVNAIFEDRQGNLWIGSRHGGLTRAKPVPCRVLWHASAQAVGLELSLDADALTLVVSDDGQGFDPNHLGRGGNGLTSMSRRASRLGGVLRVERQPGGGTRAQLRVPRDALARQETP